jgi:sugar O-acyltransferase (sialic acid O-acetyltransferase NeuD family)
MPAMKSAETRLKGGASADANTPNLDAVIFGASLQGKVVLEVLRARGRYRVIGFLDDDSGKHGTAIDGVPVLGGMEWARHNSGPKLAAIVAIGGNDARVKVLEALRTHGFDLLNAIHPSAVVMPGVALGAGNLVCAGAVIVTGTVLQDGVVVNTAASVDHDCVLRTGAYLAPGVHTAGCVDIGRAAFVGVGAILGPGVKVGEGSIVGAGSVVLSDLPPHVLAFGSPAKIVKELAEPINWRRILAGDSAARPA